MNTIYPRFWPSRLIPAGHRRLAGLLLRVLLLAALPMPWAVYAHSNPSQVGLRPTFSAQSLYRCTVRLLPDGSFGYDILADGKLVVRQTNKPALPGTRGFDTKAQATRAARLVLKKIKHGQLPPTLSAGEVRAILAN